MKVKKIILRYSLFIFFIVCCNLLILAETKEADSEKKEIVTVFAMQAMANPDYLVTVGDIYSINFLVGSTAVDYKIVVDMSYRIRVANLGVINARGLTFYQLKRQVENIVIRNYPLSGVQFILMSIGSFPVYITGEVNNASQINANAVTRLSSILKPFLTSYSSIRDVEITNYNGKTKKYDLFKASRNGDFNQDPYLRPGDKIKINRVQRSISISGGVERSGKYQLLEGEELKDLIYSYGGGFTEFADETKVVITRNSKNGEKDIGRSFALKTKEEIESFKLKNYDSVYIENSAKLRGIVFFEGSVKGKPRIESVQFMEGDDLISIVRKKRNLFSSNSDTKNAYLLRNGEKIYEDFNRIFFDPSYDEKILLESGDRIIVPFLQQVVIIAGAVMRPGSYSYVPGKTYDYYVALAGGFNIQKNTGGAVVIKDANGKKVSKKEPILPNMVITARTNSFMYHFVRYAPIITTLATILSITVTIMNLTKK